MNHQQQGARKSRLWVLFVVLGGFALSALICCGGAFYFGFGAISNLEKTYYAPCEMLTDSDECASCCRERGHTGHAHGELINENGLICGCL